MIIVTGGAGFIGSNLIHALNSSAINDILIVDNLSNASKHRNLGGAIFSDYIDKNDFLAKLQQFQSIEAIFHQGACSSTVEQDGRYMMKNNFEYSKELLHFATKRRIPFIYASSAAIYGTGAHGFSESMDDKQQPLNIYGFSKHVFDTYVQNFVKYTSSPVVGLRYFNVYGPLEGHKGRMASVIHHMLSTAKNGKNLSIFVGSESYKRDFIYVDDVVAVNLFFLDNPRSGIYNCGTGNCSSFLDAANAVKKHYDVSIEFIPFPDDLFGKYQSYTQADITRLRLVGCKQKFLSLDDGVKKYVSSIL